MQHSRKFRGRKTPGRKPFSTAKTHRELVKLLIAGGISEPVIAFRLGICQNTLRRHFGSELQFGREIKLAENLERLDGAAKKGNVAAMKHLDAKFGAGTAGHDKPSYQQRLGKKEEAAAAAITAGDGTDWGDDLRADITLAN